MGIKCASCYVQNIRLANLKHVVRLTNLKHVTGVTNLKHVIRIAPLNWPPHVQKEKKKPHSANVRLLVFHISGRELGTNSYTWPVGTSQVLMPPALSCSSSSSGSSIRRMLQTRYLRRDKGIWDQPRSLESLHVQNTHNKITLWIYSWLRKIRGSIVANKARARGNT